MDEGYVLDWLDTLVTVTLNPAKTKIATVAPGDSAKIRDQVISQKNKIQNAIKSAIFNLNDEAKIKCEIKKYHSSLIELLNQALKDQTAIHINRLRKVLDTIISSIDELLYLIERRFKGYLSLEARVPATYLAIIDKDLNKKMLVISKKFQEHQSFRSTVEVFMQDLKLFLNRPLNPHPCTFREMLYMRELCRDLENLEPTDGSGIYTELDKLLIRVNFNSRNYIENLISRITADVNNIEQTSEKMERLFFNQKIFRQLHRRPDVIFNAIDAGIYQQVDNWFSQEIFYLEKQSHFSFDSQKTETSNRITKNKETQKIVTNLSVDQMALILRAADDLRIITARSLNSVFKSIVPHLSTPNKENISYDSMRSKSYAAEWRDKEIVTETLQQMISRINEY